MTFLLEGDANDYLGKDSAAAGSSFIPRPARPSSRGQHHHRQCCIYGATSGEAYVGGMAGERFCVRNSGVRAVVETVGDHGCEYMTGGAVVVLGATGRNFAAGMSGGIAYVFDESGDFPSRCNRQMCTLEPLLDPEEIEEVRRMIKNHADWTRSPRALRMLASWDPCVPRFVKVLQKTTSACSAP